MNSFNRINYKLRPQKQIERGLIGQLLNDFSRFKATSIDYIGMGSLFFTDFLYFYKNCQLQKMYSIEILEGKDTTFDEKKKKRFINNKPLSEIELIFESAHDAIPKIDFNNNSFIWLDYDGSFDTILIDDLEILLKTFYDQKEFKDAIFAISYNNFVASSYTSYRDFFPEKCEESFKDYKITGEDYTKFTKQTYSDVALVICEKYLLNCIESFNLTHGRNNKLIRLSKIKYQDGTTMNTVIWALIDESQTDSDELIKVLKSSDIYTETEIDLVMSAFTLFEKQQIDRCDESQLVKLLDDKGLEFEDVKKYKKYAKYIPEYTEIFV